MPFIFLVALAVIIIAFVSAAISHWKELRAMTPNERQAAKDEERADMQTW
jgi:hypothetical protein